MFELFKQRSMWFHLTVSLVLNWIVGPLLMTGLAWATLPDLDHYRNGNHPYKGYLNNLEWMSGSLI
jgi:ACR3 family arsenite efflux pump ArsB